MKTVVLLILFIFSIVSKSQPSYFPPNTGNSWDSISPNALGWCTNKIDTLYDFLYNTNTKAFIVLVDGKLALEKYFGTFTKDSLWYWASAGKTVTSFLIGKAQEESYLSISDTSSKYLGTAWTNCTAAKEEKITIRNQLTMTSGLDDGVPDNHCTLDTCMIYLADAGTRWAYHNAPYTMLDGVISGATGLSLNQYYTTKLKNTIGMNGLFFKIDYNNILFSTARSMARFGLMIQNNGKWLNTAIINDSVYYNQMINTSQQLNLSYGYLWWLNGKASFMVPGLQMVFPGSMHPNAPNDMISALGKNGQIINVVKSLNMVMIRMGNVPDNSAVPINYNNDIWKKMNDIICNNTDASNKPKSIRNPPVIYQNNNEQITVVYDDVFTANIYDLNGRKIISTNKKSIELNEVAVGIYLVELITKDERITKKILVQKKY